MASKLLFLPLFLALNLHFSTLSAAQEGTLPLIDIINKADGKIIFNTIAGGRLRDTAELSPGQDYKIKPVVNDEYRAEAKFGSKFASFKPYIPGRDKGQDAIYWRADNLGFSFGYDNNNFKRDANWTSF